MTVTIKKRTHLGTDLPSEVDLEARRAATKADEFNLFYTRLTTAADGAGAIDPLKWAAEHGVTEQSIRNLRTEQKPPGLTILKRLSKASGKSINWWLGEEEAFNTDEFVFIHRYASSDDSTPITRAFRRYWVEKYLQTDPGNLIVYRVEDDAMEGTFSRADNVLVNRNYTGPVKDGIYALLINGVMVLRRVQALPNNIVRVMPDNPKYPAFEVALTDESGVEIAGFPVWYSRQI